jgi:hypothetical protein
MKLKAVIFSLFVAGSLSWTAPAWAQQICSVDTDCTQGGTECGTMTCNSDTNLCVPASTNTDDSTCTVDNQCKCQSGNHECSVDGIMGGIVTGHGVIVNNVLQVGYCRDTDTTTHNAGDTCTSSRVGPSSTSVWGIGGLALGVCLLGARRRRHRRA